MQLPYKIDFKSERNDMIESNLLNTNDNNTVYYDFNYNIYKNLQQYGEKMRYIYTYHEIAKDDIIKLNYTFEEDTKNGITDDPRNTLKAILFLINNNPDIQINEAISKIIVDFFQDDIYVDDCIDYVFNYLVKNPEKISNQIRDSIIKNTMNKLYEMDPKIVKFWIKLLNTCNFPISNGFFDFFFAQFDKLVFKQKKCFIDLFSTLLLHDIQINIQIFCNLPTLELFLIENFDIKATQILFIISKLDSLNVKFSDDFICQITDKVITSIEIDFD
ncbi:hypothetical protein M9Y10_028383 [Tritrichomonas musculus]|uniref:Uncharacterized protein n=1 Tax=Tritrichomonas musculus TaxID=1915356 RepID=A0ABR2KJX2_9EUKA